LGAEVVRICNPEQANEQEYQKTVGLIAQTIEGRGQGSGWSGAAQFAGILELPQEDWITVLQTTTTWAGWEPGTILYHGDTPPITPIFPDTGWLTEIGTAISPYGILISIKPSIFLGIESQQ
jgi:hypothetical protein